MGKKRKWFSSVSNFSTMRAKSPSRRRSVEGLCASTLLGVLHSRTLLLDTHLIYLLEQTQAGPTPPLRAHSLCSFSRTSSADGGNEGIIDIQTSSLDPLNFIGQGKLWFSSIFCVLVYLETVLTLSHTDFHLCWRWFAGFPAWPSWCLADLACGHAGLPAWVCWHVPKLLLKR